MLLLIASTSAADPPSVHATSYISLELTTSGSLSIALQTLASHYLPKRAGFPASSFHEASALPLSRELHQRKEGPIINLLLQLYIGSLSQPEQNHRQTDHGKVNVTPL